MLHAAPGLRQVVPVPMSKTPCTTVCLRGALAASNPARALTEIPRGGWVEEGEKDLRWRIRKAGTAEKAIDVGNSNIHARQRGADLGPGQSMIDNQQCCHC